MQKQFNLQINTFNELASRLIGERKRQGMSRAQAASVCNVSTSFIRDAETEPGRCTLIKLSQVINGLGLTMTVAGWQDEA